MRAFNRLVMLIIALLLIAVPVLLLLIAFGILSADTVNTFTGYRSALDSVGNVIQSPDFGNQTQLIIGVVCAALALIFLILIFRELTVVPRVDRTVYTSRQPGRETKVTAPAVRNLIEGAALEAGAESTNASLASRGRNYRVSCGIGVPDSSNVSEVATRARDNIREVLSNQDVPVTDVEVTVRDTRPQES